MSIAMKTAVTLAMAVGVLVLAIAATSWLIGMAVALLLWTLGVLVVLALAAVLPVSTHRLRARPDPALSYNEATLRFQHMVTAAEADIHPRCVPLALLHGRPTDKVYVLIHGLSNCPYTFCDWAPQLHAAGHNVLVPRMPFAGHADNATDALRNVTAQGLRAFCDECVDIATALGRDVIVLGISGGGILAAWIAQNRKEVRRAVLVSPAFGLAQFGGRVNEFIMRLTLLLPHISVWKDPIRRARGASREHSYKRQSTHATGEYMRLGLAVRRQARKGRPAAGAIVVVTNAADDSVDTSVTRQTADLWERAGADLVRHEFPPAAYLPHELIDPTEPGAMPSLVYPVLQRLAEPDLKSAPQGKVSLAH
jgi:alpha-beta hydrolase superfamily lysophospholipase